jgi:hypothetical protein
VIWTIYDEFAYVGWWAERVGNLESFFGTFDSAIVGSWVVMPLPLPTVSTREILLAVSSRKRCV